MRKLGLLAALLPVLLPGAARAGAAWSGDVDAVLAGKHLPAGDWEPVDRQGELGLLMNFQRDDWPVAAAADLLVAGRDEPDGRDGSFERRGRTSEADLGVRKIWRPDERLRPYVGGGLVIASGRLEVVRPGGTDVSEDSGAGVWLGGGVFVTLRKSLNIGLDVKLSHADVRLFGRDRDAGGLHLGLFLGYHWGV